MARRLINLTLASLILVVCVVHAIQTIIFLVDNVYSFWGAMVLSGDIAIGVGAGYWILAINRGKRSKK